MILAFDPGITTGYAMLNGEIYEFGHLPDRLAGIFNFLNVRRPDELLYEDFKHRPQMMKAELHSVKVIAIIELWSDLHNVPIKNKPLPARAKAFWTDKKIKALDLWYPGERHAMDALRVLLTHKSQVDEVWYNAMLEKLRDK